MAPPLFSIVVAVLNAADTMQRCIDSVSGQTTSDWELIIMDGGSVDGTVDIIRRNETAVTYFGLGPDNGISDAWNKGISRARGQWILFLGADDELADSTVLETVVGLLSDVAVDCRIAYGMVEFVSESGELLGRAGGPWEELKQQIPVKMAIPHPGAFHRRDLFEAGAGFDCTFRIAMDYALLLRELAHSEPQFLGNVTISRMQEGGVSNQLRSQYRSLNEMARARHILGYPRFPGRWFLLYGVALLKAAFSLLVGEKRAKRIVKAIRPPQVP